MTLITTREELYTPLFMSAQKTSLLRLFMVAHVYALIPDWPRVQTQDICSQQL